MKNLKTTLVSPLLAVPLTVLLSCLLFAGCNYSKGTKTDLGTGLSFSYNGFIVKDMILVDPADKPMTDNKVQLNTRIAIVALGVDNYGLRDGKVFPGMRLLVTDQTGKPVIDADDLFSGDQGHPPASASELRGTITVANPMAAGQTYHVKLRIWDKVNTANELNAETDLVVQ